MPEIPTIHDATISYEKWLGGLFVPFQADLEYKHTQMSDGLDSFPFFRGTYYRWAQRWPVVCAEFADAPRVLAVGDLHIENFGNWRDTDGRLCWGVNDYDEADELPLTNDLIRLATSVRLARLSGGVELKLKAACASILEGYQATMLGGGEPFVLEERHPELRGLAMSADRDPVVFWNKLTRLLAAPAADPPPTAIAELLADLPAIELKPEFRIRPQVGMGSLGKPRYVALAQWAGGWVAREAKIATPPATAWAFGQDMRSRIAEIVVKAKHAPDPYYRLGSEWICRRLAPRCSRIELTHLTGIDDTIVLFRSMGAETANVHLGSVSSVAMVLQYLKRKQDGWLANAAKAMAEVVQADWKEWRSGQVSLPSRR